MKNNWRSNLYIILAMAIMILASCHKRDAHAGHEDVYTCSMHPAVQSDKPGRCPICGMDLVLKTNMDGEQKLTEGLGTLTQSPNEVVTTTIATLTPIYMTRDIPIEARGVVTYDTRSLYTVPARVGGRLEKVYFKYAFQRIRKGQKIAEIYSPELVTAQRELLYLLENDATNEALISAAKNKLFLLGATPQHVEQVVKTKKVNYTFSIYSPYSGYVIRGDQGAPSTGKLTVSSTAGMNSMGGDIGKPQEALPALAATDLLREGSYVAAGQTLLKIINTASMRVELDLPVAKSSTITIGDVVTLDVGNGEIQQAKVDFVQPFFVQGEDFVKISVYIKQASDLQVGQLIKASLRVKTAERLWVPAKAVHDLGLTNVVFVKEHEVFKPRNVITGIREAEWIEIRQGLTTTDQLAENAAYLVDSESFIKVK